MSSDSGKDIASVVGSSITEGKHAPGAFDDPESTSYKRNDDSYPSNLEVRGHCRDKLGGSIANRNEKWYSTRYFIIKSLNYHNIQLSIERGIWATQVMNEPILEEAFNNSGKVILIFSVNMSGFFQGYAQMMSSIGWRRDSVWSQDSVRSNPWGRSFKVKWLRLNDLPFQKTLHLRNPLNDNKPVKISRDCQELPQDVGEALCELLDGNMVDGEIRRDDIHLRRTSVDSSCSSRDDEYNGPPVQMSWPQIPIPFSPVFFSQQAEANRSSFAYQRSAGTILPEKFLMTSSASAIPKLKHPRLNGNLPTLQVERGMSSQYDIWGFPADSPLTSTLTEDDFLEMSYEDYLEVHGRSTRQFGLPTMGSSRTPNESTKSRKEDDDSNSSFSPDPRHSHKRPHHSSQREIDCKHI